ncbi:MAG: right-handed parallel beta-helix repeat-containing protein [Acidimicrobiales bacterium]
MNAGPNGAEATPDGVVRRPPRRHRLAIVVLLLSFVMLAAGACTRGDVDEVSSPSQTTGTTGPQQGDDLTSGAAETPPSTGSTTTTEPPCAPLRPGDDPQAVVDGAGAGRTICFEPGRFERFSVIPLDGQHFQGVPGTVLDGLGETTHAFSTTAERKADDVTIEGLEITGYASQQRCELFRSDCSGAPVRGGVVHPHVELDIDAVPDVLVEAASSLRWTVIGNHIHDNLGTGISVGEAMRIEDNRIIGNSHLGIGGGTVGDLVIVGNEIVGNSHDERVPPNWESGQIKLGFVHDSSISVNRFSGVGPVIWCDIQCTNIEISDNSIDNIIGGRAVAIFYEVSENARIEGNVIDNVHGACTPADGVGVLLSESRDVVVTNNTITNAESSVLVQQIDRNRFSGDISHWAVTVTPDTDRLWVTRNLTITDNVLGPTTDGCEDAPGGRVGLLVEDVGNHPNTENVAPEVTFSNNDFAGTEESVAFLWPTSPTPLTFAEWTALGHS